MQETNEKGQNYADNSISMQVHDIIEKHGYRPIKATRLIMELLEGDKNIKLNVRMRGK